MPDEKMGTNMNGSLRYIFDIVQRVIIIAVLPWSVWVTTSTIRSNDFRGEGARVTAKIMVDTITASLNQFRIDERERLDDRLAKFDERIDDLPTQDTRDDIAEIRMIQHEHTTLIHQIDTRTASMAASLDVYQKTAHSHAD